MSNFGRTTLQAGFDAPGAIETNANELVSAVDVVTQLDNISDSSVSRLDDPYFTNLGSTGGTSTALTLTNADDYPQSYNTTMPFIFTMHVTSGASPTMNINGIGAVNIYDDLQNQITVAGDLVAGRRYAAQYDADADGSGTSGIVIILRFGSNAVETGQRTDTTPLTITSPGTYIYDGAGAATWTLPAGSATIQWSKFYFAAVGMGDLTIDADGSETIQGTDPFVVYAGTGLKTAVWDGETWIFSN